MTHFDVAIIGAGAAGLHCAAIAGQAGLRVALIDHAERIAEKIRISGGGRCNFTNIETSPAQFLSRNPDFCRSALARYTPRDFIDLVERHGIAWHEKHKGQLFCDGSSQQIIDMLLAECAQGGVDHRQPCTVDRVAIEGSRFALATTQGAIAARKLVVASGGLSIPKIGATDFGHRLAQTVRSCGGGAAAGARASRSRQSSPASVSSRSPAWPCRFASRPGQAPTRCRSPKTCSSRIAD